MHGRAKRKSIASSFGVALACVASCATRASSWQLFIRPSDAHRTAAVKRVFFTLAAWCAHVGRVEIGHSCKHDQYHCGPVLIPSADSDGRLSAPCTVQVQAPVRCHLRRYQRRSGREVGPNCQVKTTATLTERALIVARGGLLMRAPFPGARAPRRAHASESVPFWGSPRARRVCAALQPF